MSRERWAQGAVVAAAIVAGYLARPGATRAPEDVAFAAARSDDAAVASNARPAAARPLPRPGWRRAATPDPATFRPAVISPEELPDDDRASTDEARDERWAGPMERAMSRLLDRKLALMFPDLEASVHCRSTTCTAEMSVPPAMINKVLAFVALAVPIGPRQSPSADQRDPTLAKVSIEIDLAKTPTLEEWERWSGALESAQEATLARLLEAERKGEPWAPE